MLVIPYIELLTEEGHDGSNMKLKSYSKYIIPVEVKYNFHVISAYK